MRLLLDTHIALWALIEPDRLSESHRAAIADLGNSVHVSAASLWEIAIKFPLGRNRKDSLPFGAGDALAYFRQAGFEILNITAAHTSAIETLPLLHADPFDRMLIAQARVEPMHLISADAQVLAYY